MPLDQIPPFDDHLRKLAWEEYSRYTRATTQRQNNVWGQHCTYRRVHFRSLLEARWACYFDHLGLDWKYEPSTYCLTRAGSDVFYKPDFSLPDLKIHVEVKGPHNERLEKIGLFVKLSRESVLICRDRGQFALVSYLNDEPEDEDDVSNLPDALIQGDTKYLAFCMEHYSSLAIDEYGREATFTNRGETSDAYVGYPPRNFDSMRDRTAEDGSDARTYYWGGYSTWDQRGFVIGPNKIRRVFKKPFPER